MLPQKLNRTNDALFKFVFARKENKGIPLSFVNSVFIAKGTPVIDDLEFIDRELDPVEEDGKSSRLDLLGRAPDDTNVEVEIQVEQLMLMGDRSLYYWARLYNSLKSGDDYDRLRRTVMINVLDFNLFDPKAFPDFHHCFGVYDPEKNLRLTSHLEIHTLELPKWKLEKPIGELTGLEKWMSYFSKKTTPEELEAIAMTEPMMQEALKREIIFTQDEIQRRLYEKTEKYHRDQRAIDQYNLNRGIDIGMNLGMNRGIDIGMNQGKSDMVLRLLRARQPLDLIMQVSQFSHEKIAEIGRQNGIVV